MSIKDSEPDYLNETEAELRSRITQYLVYARVQSLGYTALRSYGVDYQSLPEWKDDADLDIARKLKPIKGSELVVAWLMRLEHAIKAAIKRKQLVGLNGGKAPTTH